MAADFAVDNPFWVLELGVDASNMDIERAGKKWLAMLEVGAVTAGQYTTPSGPRPRHADAVRQAMVALREPMSRLQAVAWLEWHTLTCVADPASESFPSLRALRRLPTIEERR
jgi:hypothetical protein